MAIIHEGKVLYQGEPQAAISGLNGRIWHRSIEKRNWRHYEQTFRVVSNKLVGGRPFLHVFGEAAPGDGFLPSQADLEDVFFTKIRNWD